MQTSLTFTLERNATISDTSWTEPYEAGWAGEAIWFVHVFELGNKSKAAFVPQISPDGIHWCDSNEAKAITISEPGMYAIPIVALRSLVTAV